MASPMFSLPSEIRTMRRWPVSGNAAVPRRIARRDIGSFGADDRLDFLHIDDRIGRHSKPHRRRKQARPPVDVLCVSWNDLLT